MDKAQQNFAVMFADIAGSTHLYERLGDQLANRMIGAAIKLASEIIKHYQGTVVKTIGDEVMCRFSNADHAIRCACKIHETMHTQPVQQGVVLVFRMGIHWGPALLQNDGDIFGDAVNLAARMAGLAKARQIITTDITKNELTDNELISKCRIIDRVKVKGKSEPVSIIEVIWEPNEVTRMSTMIFEHVNADSEPPLHLFFQQNKHTIEQGAAAYVFGRDRDCSYIINSSLASRLHAKIENRRGKYILIDESTNGTYVQFDGKPAIFLRREEVVLQGNGVISFGEKINKTSEGLLRFSV